MGKRTIRRRVFLLKKRDFLGCLFMDIRKKNTLYVAAVTIVLACLVIGGCGGSAKTAKPAKPEIKLDLSTTVGSLAEVFSPESIPVEGYSIVGGLRGTGSEECPEQIREYLEKYIKRQLPEEKDIERYISSPDTAVVHAFGFMPVTGSKGQKFDIKVAALSGTQTTSLEGGALLGVELFEGGKFGAALKVLSKADGTVYIDKIDNPQPDKKVGYILGGATVQSEYKINLALRQPDYKTASLIANRLNGRFGGGTARAVSPGLVELKAPAKYAKQKQRFVSIAMATYLVDSPEVTKDRIAAFIKKLAVSEEKKQGEIALEAIGKESLGKLAVLLNSSNEKVRLRAGRCMLNMGSDQGLIVLREIAMDKNAAGRIEAMDAITLAANRNDAAALSRLLLRDENLDVVLAAYENLRKLDDVSINQKQVGGIFYLEQISQTSIKAVFASRSGQPRIALFGGSLKCRDDIFVQSADGEITINSAPGQGFVTIMRKHPTRANIPPIQLRSSFELSDIIAILCESPVAKSESKVRTGLGVSYADMIAIVRLMCEKGAVNAQFRAGALPKID